jgi:glutaredoxin
MNKIAMYIVIFAISMLIGGVAKYFWPSNSFGLVFGDFQNLMQNKAENEFVIYTKFKCDACFLAKSFMKKNNISFQERDIEFSKAYKDNLEELDIHQVPVLVSNNAILLGYEETAWNFFVEEYRLD